MHEIIVFKQIDIINYIIGRKINSRGRNYNVQTNNLKKRHLVIFIGRRKNGRNESGERGEKNESGEIKEENF